MKDFSFLIFFIFSSIISTAQVYVLSGVDTIKTQIKAYDSLSIVQEVENLRILSISDGYIYSEVDSFYNVNDSWYVKFYKGAKLNHIIYKIIEESDTIDLKRTNYKKLRERTLNEYLNNGYPFARLELNATVSRSEDEMTTYWKVRKGPFIEYDTASISGVSNYKTKYIQNAYGIPIGKPFNENIFKNITARNNRISFYKITSEPEIYFRDNKATVSLNLNERKVNTFEGVIGLLPGGGANSNSVITGYIDLNLLNIGHSGKELNFNWQRFDQESQQLKVRYLQPYLFNSFLNIEGDINLLKQDSTFTQNLFSVGVFTYLENNLRIRFGYEAEFNTVQSQNVEDNLTSTNVNWYNLEINRIGLTNIESTDFLNYAGEVALGRREISNLSVDTIPKRSNSSFAKAHISGQKMLSDNLAVFSGLFGALKYNETLFENELLRLGGFKTFRGFNEFQFFLSEYVYTNVEFRYFFENSSYLFILNDLGFLSPGESVRFDSPWHYSLGFGLSLRNKNGIFSIIFANGSQFSQNISVTNTNVHFGYISTF